MLCTIRLPSLSAGHCLTGSVSRSSVHTHTLGFNLSMWWREDPVEDAQQPLFTAFFSMSLGYQSSEIKIIAGEAISRSRYVELVWFASSMDLNISLSVPMSGERDIKLFHKVSERDDKCF